MEICLEVGIDWAKDIGSKLPGCPTWCPATHFGYLKSGEMTMNFEDGSPSVVIKAGDTYHIGPGHKPTVTSAENATMIEFSEDPAVQKMVDASK